MNGRSGTQTAAFAVLVLIGFWTLAALAAFVWQDLLVRIFIPDADLIKETGRIVVAGDIARFVCCIPIAIACLMVIQGKGRTAPMVASVIGALLMPVVPSLVMTLQMRYVSLLFGSDAMAKLGTASNFSAFFSYLLYAACITAVAATTMHSCAAKNPGLTQNLHEEERIK